jgi:hypothetical protein
MEIAPACTFHPHIKKQMNQPGRPASRRAQHGRTNLAVHDRIGLLAGHRYVQAAIGSQYGFDMSISAAAIPWACEVNHGRCYSPKRYPHIEAVFVPGWRSIYLALTARDMALVAVVPSDADE